MHWIEDDICIIQEISKTLVHNGIVLETEYCSVAQNVFSSLCIASPILRIKATILSFSIWSLLLNASLILVSLVTS